MPIQGVREVGEADLAFVALADGEGDLQHALDGAVPDAREVLERAAVADLDLDPDVEARTLIAAAARRELRQRSGPLDLTVIEQDRDARLNLETLMEADRERALEAAEALLTWLDRRSEERSGGEG